MLTACTTMDPCQLVSASRTSVWMEKHTVTSTGVYMVPPQEAVFVVDTALPLLSTK